MIRAKGDVGVARPPLWSRGRELAWAFGGGALSVLLTSLIFQPITWWPLAFFCLAPWAFAVCRIERAWIAHWASYVAGVVFFLINLRWLEPVTGLGYVALCFYLGVYWSLAGWALRTAWRLRIAPVWTLPFVWVATEFLRGTVMSGFPWLFLSHALAGQLAFIQISDITGAYGVTFLLAMCNGALATWPLTRSRQATTRPARRQITFGAVLLIALMVANVWYGLQRMRAANLQPGPMIAVVQEDFPLSSVPSDNKPQELIFARYLQVAAEAAQGRPDLLVLPETPWSMAQNVDFIESTHRVEPLLDLLRRYGRLYHTATGAFARGDYKTVNAQLAALERSMRDEERRQLPEGKLPRLPGVDDAPAVTLLVGAMAFEAPEHATYPPHKRFNSALVYNADGTQRRERYDKMHLVPFGEVVPFRQAKWWGFDLHWLYRWLNNLSPFSYGGKYEYSLYAGSAPSSFSIDYDGRKARFATPICYEDVIPYLCRAQVWEGSRRRVDFLVNISNDGWFLHSAELPQHLAICVFRAVENRVSVARSVNTGISGFINPNGEVYGLVTKDGRAHGPGIVGFSQARVSLDDRTSLYGAWGDWFAFVCLIVSCVLWGGAIISRWIAALLRRARRLIWKGGRGAGAAGSTLALVALLLPGCQAPGGGGGTSGNSANVDQGDLRGRALRLLLTAAEEEQDVVAANAIEALVEVAPAEGAPAIRAATDSPSQLKRFAAFIALGEMRDRAAIEAIRTAARRERGRVRLAAIFAAYRCGDQTQISDLLAVLTSDPDENNRADAAFLLGRLDERKALERMRLMAGREKSRKVLTQLHIAMAQLGDTEALDRLIQLTQGEVVSRTLALQGLIELRDPRARDAFEVTLRSAPAGMDPLRLIAARGLGELGSNEGYQLALENLSFRSKQSGALEAETENMQMRSLAAMALGAIRDPKALPALRTLVENETDERTQVAGCYAILRILNR